MIKSGNRLHSVHEIHKQMMTWQQGKACAESITQWECAWLYENEVPQLLIFLQHPLQDTHEGHCCKPFPSPPFGSSFWKKETKMERHVNQTAQIYPGPSVFQGKSHALLVPCHCQAFQLPQWLLPERNKTSPEFSLLSSFLKMLLSGPDLVPIQGRFSCPADNSLG